MSDSAKKDARSKYPKAIDEKQNKMQEGRDGKQDLGIDKFRIDNEECRIPQKKTQEASTQKLLTRSKTRDKNREMGNKTWELINSELTMKNVGFRKKDARSKYPKAIDENQNKRQEVIEEKQDFGIDKLRINNE